MAEGRNHDSTGGSLLVLVVSVVAEVPSLSVENRGSRWMDEFSLTPNRGCGPLHVQQLVGDAVGRTCRGSQ